MTWHPADALEQSEAGSNTAFKLRTRRPFTASDGAWPTIGDLSSEAKRRSVVFRRTRPTR
ncbi:hypothetical protein [Rhodopirellula bahusiensis]|uniref:hypothetical protein n=1 Tax=Rhodopirellula bahusiensis TaxID=2014065 RepID=UPI003D64C266